MCCSAHGSFKREIYISRNICKENRDKSLYIKTRKKNEMNRALGHLCAHIG